MPNKATTVRLEPALQDGLETLSKVLKRPMNQLINDALRDYVNRRSYEVEQDLNKTLIALRACRRRDPGLKGAEIATVVNGELIDGSVADEFGPVETEFHQLLQG